MPNRRENDNEAFANQTDAACDAWEALLPDAVEDLLGEAEAQALELHLAGCARCSAELAEARRGAAWLSLLKNESPEPPRNMVAAILASTSGAPTLADAAAEEWSLQAVPVPAGTMPAAQLWFVPATAATQPDESGTARGWLARWLGLDGRLFPSLQPRLTMTAAMAFCSICLTLNLLGISVTRLHAEDLHPAGLQRTMAGKSATLLRSVEGIRIVYRVESRVNDWLTASTMQDGAKLQQ